MSSGEGEAHSQPGARGKEPAESQVLCQHRLCCGRVRGRAPAVLGWALCLPYPTIPPAQPRVASPSLLAAQLTSLGAGGRGASRGKQNLGTSQRRVPRGSLSVCPSVSLCTRYLSRPIPTSRSRCRILPARGAGGCCSHLHAQAVCSDPVFCTGEGWGAWPSSRLLPPLLLPALLGEPCFRTLTFSCK